jgi:hypothetical protein
MFSRRQVEKERPVSSLLKRAIFALSILLRDAPALSPCMQENNNIRLTTSITTAGFFMSKISDPR